MVGLFISDITTVENLWPTELLLYKNGDFLQTQSVICKPRTESVVCKTWIESVFYKSRTQSVFSQSSPYFTTCQTKSNNCFIIDFKPKIINMAVKQ